MSVVMPVFNAGRYLDRALESVLTQGVDSLEVICVDDGSSDNSGEILRGCASRDKRIRLFKQPNAGQGAARNLALEQATGDYVAFVDADDLLLPGALKQMLARVGDSDVLVYDFVRFRNEAQLAGKRDLPDEPAKVVPREDLLRMMGVVWNKLVQRRWLESVAFRFPEGMIYEDIPAHWKLILLPERIRHLGSPLYALRAHSGSTTANAGLRRMDSANAFRMVEEFLRASGNWPEYRDVFLPCQLRNLAQMCDALSEQGEEAIARAAVDRDMGTEQRAALCRLPLHWRDRDVFFSMEGNRLAKTRRYAFTRLRKAYRTFKKRLVLQR